MVKGSGVCAAPEVTWQPQQLPLPSTQQPPDEWLHITPQRLWPTQPAFTASETSASQPPFCREGQAPESWPYSAKVTAVMTPPGAQASSSCAPSACGSTGRRAVSGGTWVGGGRQGGERALTPVAQVDAGWARVRWVAAASPSATANLSILRGVREGTAVLPLRERRGAPQHSHKFRLQLYSIQD